MAGLLKLSGCDRPERLIDVIFVHGLDGDGRTTWHPKDKPDDSWPAWLGEEFPDAGIWSLDYEAASLAWKGHSMPLYDRAKNTLDCLDLAGIGRRPIGFVCHSLGGLLIKQVVQLACEFRNERWKDIADRTAFIVFLATPHSGADMANWISYIGTLLRPNVSVKELQKHDPSLRQLNDWYRDNVENLRITTAVYCETRPTAGIMVVNATTANPGIPGVHLIPLDADHITICKPESKNAQVYQRVTRLIIEAVGAGGGGTQTTELFDRFFKARKKRWSDTCYALDTRFVNLTLLLDQGEEAQGPRWQVGSERFRNLHEVLDRTPAQTLVLLGPPGSGKSTLLRHFELDCANWALENATAQDLAAAPLTFFIQLSEYKPAHSSDPLPLPSDWLAERWEQQNPDLPGLESLLREGRITLLLDALNEIPYTGTEPVRLWKDFLRELAHNRSKSRVIFSCRSLDYSAFLSSNELSVPHVRIEPLSDEQVRQFVEVYSSSPDHGQKLWEQLKDSPQLDLFRSPYYLKMLVDQAAEGELPGGRAALFSGFVRQLSRREVKGDNPLFQAGDLLHQRDVLRLGHARQWKSAFDLPERGILIPKLSRLAYRMQAQRPTNEAGQVRVDYDDALDLLDDASAADILNAGMALDVLQHDLERDEVLYVHQLMQEYFAARTLARNPKRDLVRREWRAAEVKPRLDDTLVALRDSELLPPLPGTGWEETTVLAGAMAEDPDGFVADLMEANLALAGGCAA